VGRRSLSYGHIRDQTRSLITFETRPSNYICSSTRVVSGPLTCLLNLGVGTENSNIGSLRILLPPCADDGPAPGSTGLRNICELSSSGAGGVVSLCGRAVCGRCSSSSSSSSSSPNILFHGPWGMGAERACPRSRSFSAQSAASHNFCAALLPSSKISMASLSHLKVGSTAGVGSRGVIS
jgi:hypothetical protein